MSDHLNTLFFLQKNGGERRKTSTDLGFYFPVYGLYRSILNTFFFDHFHHRLNLLSCYVVFFVIFSWFSLLFMFLLSEKIQQVYSILVYFKNTFFIIHIVYIFAICCDKGLEMISLARNIVETIAIEFPCEEDRCNDEAVKSLWSQRLER